jgi:hypothetical protein
MVDLGENPIATMLYAIWDLIKWTLVIVSTWFGGLVAGDCLGWIIRRLDLRWLEWIVTKTGGPCVILGVGITLLGWYLPMQIESRKLAIWTASANFTVWMIVGANISWFSM